MEHLIQLDTPAEFEHYKDVAGAPALDGEKIKADAPDVTLLLVGPGSRLRGRCSLWWSDVPRVPGEHLGLIGHFAANNREATRKILTHAVDRLRAEHCSQVVAPMDGTTWSRYRFVTQKGSEPSFFMEPENPESWPFYFLECGFQPLAHYYSGRTEDLNHPDPRAEWADRRLYKNGIRIRSLRIEEFEAELERIYEISIKSFQDNLLYHPISLEKFIAFYTSFKNHIRPQLVLFAEKEENPVGFIFGVPDLSQARRGEDVDTLIVKSMAVVPEWRRGLGSVLMARVHAAAYEMGYRKAIHALICEGNRSQKVSGFYAQTFRRYTLYSRRVEP